MGLPEIELIFPIAARLNTHRDSIKVYNLQFITTDTYSFLPAWGGEGDKRRVVISDPDTTVKLNSPTVSHVGMTSRVHAVSLGHMPSAVHML